MIDQKVVHNASIFIWEAGILYFPRCEGSYVIGSHFLQKVQSMGTFHPKFSHVWDVEYTDTLTYCKNTIIQKGRKNIRYYVKDYENSLFDLK